MKLRSRLLQQIQLQIAGIKNAIDANSQNR